MYFFSDDDKYDLKTMYEREKLSTAEDQNGMLSRYGHNFIWFYLIITGRKGEKLMIFNYRRVP